MAARQHLSRVLGVALGCLLGCAGLPVALEPAPRVSEFVAAGDARFQASQRLVIEGLDADASGNRHRARGRYDAALQIDSSNPWAYLALARHYVEAGSAQEALAHVDRAEALFESGAIGSPGALLHCDGLRGAALALQGRNVEARALLDPVAERAPGVWGDATLSAAELR